MIKAVLFDMDGVLVSAKDWHYEALNQALSLYGFNINYKDHLIKYDGLSTKQKLEILTRERGLSQALHEAINSLKQEKTLSVIYKKCSPNPVHQEALAKLKERGYKLAVCSNSISNTIEIIMQKVKLQKYLEFFLSNEDVINPKPSPEIYQKAMKRLGLSPSECLILEDNEKGIRAAMNSGAHLMRVENIEDVNYPDIIGHIKKIESKQMALL